MKPKVKKEITVSEANEPTLELFLFLLKVCLIPIYILKALRRKPCLKL